MTELEVRGHHTDGVVAHGVGAREGLGEWEPDPRMVRQEVLSEDIKAGRHYGGSEEIKTWR